MEKLLHFCVWDFFYKSEIIIFKKRLGFSKKGQKSFFMLFGWLIWEMNNWFFSLISHEKLHLICLVFGLGFLDDVGSHDFNVGNVAYNSMPKSNRT
jgi:hypothetical protein